MNPSASRFLRRLCSSAGLVVFRTKTIPRGIQLEADLRRLLAREPNPVVIDVGANVGQTTKRLKAAFPTSTVYAFEPASETFRRLQRATEGLPKVSLNRAALGERNGNARLLLATQSEWNRLAKSNDEESWPLSRTEEVPLVRLDTFSQGQGIDRISLLKTDCEGYDSQVLRGAENLFAMGAIESVYCEVNFRSDGKHGDFYEIDAHLRARDFVLYGLYEYSGWKYNVATQGFTNALWVRSALLEQVAVE